MLAAGQAVLLGFRLWRAFHLTTDGQLTLPVPGDTLLDGHAVLAVGYEDATGSGAGHLIVRNSWGSDWGDGGHGYLPFDYFDQHGAEAWVLELP